MKKTLWDVILSAAKKLCGATMSGWMSPILRGAQNDMSGPVFEGKPGNNERGTINEIAANRW